MEIETNAEKANTMEISDNKKKIKSIRLKIYEILKRCVDIIGALFGMIILVPTTIIVFIMSIILNESDGPLFYTQKRIGKNGKYFKLYKFRSMCKDAEDKLAVYLAENEEAREEFKKTQKLQNDPRITKMGKVLRKTSLDELPQMINILKGDMSFIGPRPVIDGEIERYEEIGKKDKFLSVKPGLTGYWQVNGRSTTSYEDRIKLELYYVDNKSLWLDIKIFLKTFISVFKGEGAI